MKSAGVYRASADLQKCGFEERKFSGATMQVGEVATPAAGDEDLLADALGALQHGHATPAFAGFDGAHQPGSATAQNDYVERLLKLSPHRAEADWVCSRVFGVRTAQHGHQQQRHVVGKVAISVLADVVHDVRVPLRQRLIGSAIHESSQSLAAKLFAGFVGRLAHAVGVEQQLIAC